MGALRIPLHHYLIGTVLGMLPGMLATTVLGRSVDRCAFRAHAANRLDRGACGVGDRHDRLRGQRWLRHADADDRSKRRVRISRAISCVSNAAQECRPRRETRVPSRPFPVDAAARGRARIASRGRACKLQSARPAHRSGGLL
jgi:hypothetical protein